MRGFLLALACDGNLRTIASNFLTTFCPQGAKFPFGALRSKNFSLALLLSQILLPSRSTSNLRLRRGLLKTNYTACARLPCFSRYMRPIFDCTKTPQKPWRATLSALTGLYCFILRALRLKPCLRVLFFPPIGGHTSQTPNRKRLGVRAVSQTVAVATGKRETHGLRR